MIEYMRGQSIIEWVTIAVTHKERGLKKSATINCRDMNHYDKEILPHFH